MVSLFYVPGTIDKFNWHYYMNFRHMFHICDIYILGIFKKTAAVNKYCVSIKEFEPEIYKFLPIVSDYGKQNSMKNVNSSLRQSLNNFLALSTALPNLRILENKKYLTSKQ